MKEKKICSNCIESFNQTDIYVALVPNREYYTLYCEKCIKELKITEYKPYVKNRKPKNEK